MDIKNRFHVFCEYVAVHAPISYDEAKRLFPICDLIKIEKEKVVKDLIFRKGDWAMLRREYVLTLETGKNEKEN